MSVSSPFLWRRIINEWQYLYSKIPVLNMLLKSFVQLFWKILKEGQSWVCSFVYFEDDPFYLKIISAWNSRVRWAWWSRWARPAQVTWCARWRRQTHCRLCRSTGQRRRAWRAARTAPRRRPTPSRPPARPPVGARRARGTSCANTALYTRLTNTKKED